MKVIHVLKRIETIDQDIKELRKLEKSLERNKSFTGPIFLTIEKQINLLLGERIKMLELEIKNPPESLQKEIEGDDTAVADTPVINQPMKPKSKKAEAPAKAKKAAAKPSKAEKTPAPAMDDDDDDDIPMPILTQDAIDRKIDQIKNDPESHPMSAADEETAIPDSSVKLLDIALEKGTLDRKTVAQEKKRIRFFRDNFPGGEY